MGIFNSIKKSRRESSDIDGKIEYLNKELEKTGLREAMTTSNMYVGGQEVANTTYTNFNNATFNNLPLGHSGADGAGNGGAYTGKMIPSEVGLQVGYHDYLLNLDGVALSPKHPVSGKRRYASTRTGMVSYSPTQPGKYQGNSEYPTGSVMWLWNPNANNSDDTTGNWYPLEFDVVQGKWGFWDTGFLGFGFLNTNLSQLELPGSGNVGATVTSLFSSLNITNTNNIGTETTIVLQKNNLDDPDFIPINIDGLSTQGFDYLKDKAGVNISSSYYSPEDKKNVINYYKKIQADPNYRPKPFERESLMRQMRAQGEGPQFASADTSFPPSDPDKFPVDPPPESPDEPPAPSEPNPYPEDKANPAGLDARAIRLGYNDPYYPVNPTGHYIAMVKTAQDILSAEMEAEFYSAAARGESPNYDTSSINQAKENLKQARENSDNWERWKKENNYIWKGSIESSAEDDIKKDLLDKDKRIDNELEKLEKDLANTGSFSKKISEVKKVVGDKLKELGDFWDSAVDTAKTVKSTIDAIPTSGNTLVGWAKNNNPDHPDYRKNDPTSDNYEGPLEAKTSTTWKNEVGEQLKNSLPDKSDYEFDGQEGPSWEERLENSNDGKVQLSDYEIKKLSDQMSPGVNGDMRFHTLFNSLPPDVTDVSINSEGEIDIVSNYRFTDRDDVSSGGPLMKNWVSNIAKTDKTGETFPFLDKEGGTQIGNVHDINIKLTLNMNGNNKSNWIREELQKESYITEDVKLGHFEPEQLNVDIEDLRKGIMPEFPKDPPPKLINGYSEKSKLAPKELERTPFIKITKKDLAKNHRLKDSEIKSFMGTINAVNDFIKKHPEELVYAQTRYPKDDPRLAQLNWQMDQMLGAGKEYMDKQYPENQKLFKKVQKAIGKTIELTDPKSFKDVKVPKFKGVDLTDFKRRKEVVARHYKKAVKIERLFSNKKRRNNIKEEIECKKTNLQEIMTTSNMYFSGEKVPNQDYNDFEGTSEGGYGLGLSGADGNNVGNADVGVHLGTNGVALSPPHPVTGVRHQALHVRDGLGGTEPLKPGAVIKRGFADNAPDYTMGSALWFFDSSYNSGEGRWCNFEWGNFENNTGWGFWDTIKTGQFAGLWVFNRTLGAHPCAGGDLESKISGLNFSLNGTVGAPQTTVLFKKDLGDPDHLPINIPGLSGEAFDYLFAGANYDLYNWILKTYGMEAAEWYLKTGKSQGNPYLPGGAYVPRADAGKPVPDGTNVALFGWGGRGGKPIDPAVYGGPRGALGRDVEKFNKMSPLSGGSGGVFKLSHVPEGDLLSEDAKLGHFEPDQLNVDIEDLRKGIMPEFPKDPPSAMIDGYAANSKLAPKQLDTAPYIKITRKDLAQNHKLKDSEIEDFMNKINAVNDFIKKHPEELVYAQTRYPKDDSRLAQLNWEMDQRLNASKEFMNKHYPENQKLFKKVQRSIKKNIELTNPKSFKGVKVPKFKGIDLTDFKRRKEVVSRHYKKVIKIKSLFNRKKT